MKPAPLLLRPRPLRDARRAVDIGRFLSRVLAVAAARRREFKSEPDYNAPAVRSMQ